MKKLTAAQRFDRLREIESIREELLPEHNDLKGKLSTCQGHLAHLQKELNWMLSPPPHARISRAPGEPSRTKKEIQEFKQKGDTLEEQLRPLQERLDQLAKEEEDLRQNPPKVTAKDLQYARAEISKVDAQIARIEQAQEQSVSRTPTEGIDALKDEIAKVASDRDLLAADLDLGEGSEAELKKATTNLTKLKKQLAEQEETASLASATQRGYEKRLADLTAARQRADHEFRCLLSLRAKALHDAGTQTLVTACDEIQKALVDIMAANQLSNRYGDGEEFSFVTGTAKLVVSGLHGHESGSIAPDQHMVTEKVEEILAEIQKS